MESLIFIEPKICKMCKTKYYKNWDENRSTERPYVACSSLCYNAIILCEFDKQFKYRSKKNNMLDELNTNISIVKLRYRINAGTKGYTANRLMSNDSRTIKLMNKYNSF